MQISLRSYLAAGSAAVVGAGAIALTPVISQPMTVPAIPAAATANIELAAGIADLLPAVQTALGGTSTAAQAAIGGIVAQVSGYQDDLLTFVSALAGGLGKVAKTSIGTVVPTIVNAIVELIPDAAKNGIGPALTHLQTSLATAISGPVTALTGAVNVVVGIVTQAVAGLTAGLGAIGQLVPAYTAVLGNSFDSAVEAAGSALATSGFGSGVAAGTLLNGLLGPNGVAGTLVNLTLGTGVQTTPAVVGPGFTVPNTGGTVSYVPSVRTVVLKGVETTGAAIYAGVQQALPAGSRKARSASSVSAAASVAAPAAAVAAGSSAKSAKHGVTRRAARAN